LTFGRCPPYYTFLSVVRRKNRNIGPFHAVQRLLDKNSQPKDMNSLSSPDSTFALSCSCRGYTGALFDMWDPTVFWSQPKKGTFCCHARLLQSGQLQNVVHALSTLDSTFALDCSGGGYTEAPLDHDPRLYSGLTHKKKRFHATQTVTNFITKTIMSVCLFVFLSDCPSLIYIHGGSERQ
jgi:hypothetical protein